MTSERNKAIAIAVLSGETFEAVGHSYGLTRESARRITRNMVWRVDPEHAYLHNRRRYGLPKHSPNSAHALRADAARLISLMQNLPSPESPPVPPHDVPRGTEKP